MSKVTLLHEVHDMWPSTLIEVGGMNKNHPFVRLIQMGENSAYKNSDKVISILPYAEKYMKEHGLGEGKFIHIPNGVVREDWENAENLPDELERELEKHREQKKFVVGYFGGHALSNALDALLDSAKLLNDRKDIIFIFVGKGVEKERLLQRCQNEHIDNVRFYNAISKMCIPNLIKYFDCVYVGALDSPLYRFGLGANKLYDTMMAGKPVVLSVNAPKTIIEEYGCGIVVPAGDANKIKDAIEKLFFMTPEERQCMGIKGKQAVLDYFTYDKLAIDFEKAMDNEKKKNILIINHYSGSPEMGMEFRPYYFARKWIEHGYRVDIIAANYSHLRVNNPRVERDFEEQIIDGIHYHWIRTNMYSGNGLKRAITMFQFVAKLWFNAKKIAKELKPDVIITSSTYPLDTYAGQKIRKIRSKMK